MRDLVLNEASLWASNIEIATSWTKEIADALSIILSQHGFSRVLRLKKELYEIAVFDKGTMYDVLAELRRRGHIDAFRLLGGLATKVPLLLDLGDKVRDRFLRCEESSLEGEDGEPLLLCAHTQAVLISFPSRPTWDQDRINVHFYEMQVDQSVLENEEQIDNVARVAHTSEVIDRHRSSLRDSISTVDDIWKHKEEAFPHLRFGPDVRSHLGTIQNGMVDTIVSRLSELDLSSADWRTSKGTMPNWRCKVTPESSSVLDNPKLCDARRFRSEQGGRFVFSWHARCGSAYRIHLRFDPASLFVEVGYIGIHLPL